MAGRNDWWTGRPVNRWTGLTAVVLFGLVAGCREKAPAAPDTSKAGANAPAAAPSPNAAAPDSFRVAFETTRGNFVVQVNRAWAPLGADHFYQLVGQQFFDGVKFFRVVPGFVAQFGMSGDPKRNASEDSRHILDDSVRHTNAKGTLTFAAMSLPNSRSHQLFFNLKDNTQLDKMGFAPIGVVVEGQSVVDSLYSGYGEEPDQTSIGNLGNSYLDRAFPKLDAIKTARIVK
jgi:peptidyl-prolyl cis-trans isomerase A (cyclophilin A)